MRTIPRFCRQQANTYSLDTRPLREREHKCQLSPIVMHPLHIARSLQGERPATVAARYVECSAYLTGQSNLHPMP